MMQGLCYNQLGNVLFNDIFNTFYLRLYRVGYMVNNYSDSERKIVGTTSWAILSN